jgi:hypothetical protein
MRFRRFCSTSAAQILASSGEIAVLAVGATTLLIDAATLPSSVAQANTAIYVQAIHLALPAIGLLLISIFSVLIVMLLPKKERIELP